MKNLMKKLTAALLGAALLTASFAGCASNAGEAGGDKKLNVGIVQLMEHPSLNTIRESFLEEMKALGYSEDDITFDYQEGQGEQTNLNSICQKFAGDKKDLIVAIATQSAQAAAASSKEIPVLFSAVTDPVAAKLLSDPEHPDKNSTGTSDAIPVDQVFQLAGKLTPNAKTFGLLYNSSEVNSVSVINEVKAYCSAHGIQVVEATVTNTSEVAQAVQSLIGRVDAIYSPIDNTVASAMPTVTQLTREAKLPVYTGADSMVADGGLATVGIDYTVLGKQTARMADKLLKGTPVSEIPVEILDNFAVVINQTTADALGITIPDELSSTAQIVK